MARPCTVCTHEQRPAIDRALVAGTPLRQITAKFRVSPDSALRHKGRHLPLRLLKSHEAAEAAEADALLAQLRGLQARALVILDTAEGTGQLMAALAAIREARGCLELLAKLLGELSDAPQVNVLVSPEWLAVRSAVLEALRPYPDARIAVADRLSAAGAA